MLAKSQRPMICVGRGVLIHRAETELALLAEAISAPVLSTYDSNGAIAEDHSLAVGIYEEWQKNLLATKLLKKSDFLLCLGLRSNTSLSESLFEKAPRNVVFVALDEQYTLHLMDGIITVISDTRIFLSQLLLHIDEFRRPVDNIIKKYIARHKSDAKKRLKVKMNILRGLPKNLAPYKNEKKLNFGVLIEELFSRLKKDAIIVSGVGNHAIWGKTLSRIENRESFLQEGSWGTMGSELAGGIAAKLIYPERQVVVITGDGSLLMSSADFITAVEIAANILVVVLNDSRYGMITDMQLVRFGRSIGDKIGTINFAQFAQSFGAAGVRIESFGKVIEALEQALALNKRTPVILDAVCNHELHGNYSVIVRKLRKMKRTFQKTVFGI
jgi:acetolactate synthase-1/2/3 large subunit